MAVNLKKEKDNLAIINILTSIMESTSYTFKEMLELIKNNNFDEKVTESSLIFLSEIIDESMNGTVEIKNSAIVFYGSKFMLREVYENQKNNINQNINSSQFDSSSNINQSIDNNQSNGNDVSEANTYSNVNNSVNNVSINNNPSNNQTVNQIINQIIDKKLDEKLELENMYVGDLINYLFYVKRIHNCAGAELSLLRIRDYLNNVNISRNKLEECIEYLQKILNVSNDKSSYQIDFDVSVFEGKKIVKHVTSKGTYYYFIKNDAFVFQKYNNDIQKYFSSNTQMLSNIQFNPMTDYLLRGVKIDDLGLWRLAIDGMEAYKNKSVFLFDGTEIDQIKCNFKELVPDFIRYQSCMFSLEKLINDGEISYSGSMYKITNYDRQYYGFCSFFSLVNSDHEVIKYIRNLVEEFLYENMIVLIKPTNQFGYMAIPARYIYVAFTDSDKHFCCIDARKNLHDEIKKAIKENRKKGCYSAIYDIYDLSDGTILTNTAYIAQTIDEYAFVNLSDVYKQVVGKPTICVTLESLDNVISISDLIKINKKGKQKFLKW